MSHTLTDGTTTVTLDHDWIDEYDWSPVEQTSDYTLTGALVVEQATRQAGRPITLAPPRPDMAWTAKADLDRLRAWAETPGQQLMLTLEDGRSYTVLFRHEDTAIDAEPVRGWRVPAGEPDDWWLVTLRLIEI